MSGAEQALATLRDYVQRTTHWEEGGATRHDAKLALDAADDAVEWIEKGIVEWRDEAMSATKQAKAARATARIAIAHLHAVLAKPDRTCAIRQQKDALAKARDWLESIGSEPA